MPPPVKHNHTTILFDLKMDRDKSIPILEDIILHKIAVEPKHRMDLVLLHTKRTDNFSGYNHIHFAVEDTLYDLQFCKCIEKREVADADWLEGLDLCVEIIKPFGENKSVFNSQIVFITDMASKATNLKLIEKIIKDLGDYEIYLFIVGPDVTFEGTISTWNDIIRAMKTARFIDERNDAEIALKIIREAEGVICGPDLALDFLTFYCDPISKQPWMEPLTFMDTNLKFPTTCLRIVSKQKLLKINAPPVDQRKVVVEDDEMATEVVVEPKDIIRMHKLMGALINIPPDVAQSFKYDGPRLFRLIGFVDHKYIPEIYLTGDQVYTVTVDETKPKAKVFFELIRQLKDLDRFGLALKAHNARNIPRLFVLIPQPPDHFLMVLHPSCAKKINRYEDKPKGNPTEVPEDLLNATKEHLKNLSITEIKLHPSASIGTFFKNYYRNVNTMINKNADIKKAPSSKSINKFEEMEG